MGEFSSSQGASEALPESAQEDTQLKQHLTLHVLSTRQQLNVTVEDKVVLGRSADSESDGTPSVDLSPFLAYQLGVSRRHLMLVQQENGQVVALDLASSNGSFLNGQRLSAHKGQPIHEGDELTLGSLSMRVYFTKDVPFAHLQTRQLAPARVTTEEGQSRSSLAMPVPSIRETLTTQIRHLDGPKNGLEEAGLT
jgi:pSer/pThr/pTyr-binding forkhead associated (FHA) protein